MIIWADFPTENVGMYGLDETKMGDGLYADRTMLLAEDPHPDIVGNVLQFTQLDKLRFILPANKQTMGVALRYWPDGFASVTHQLFCFRNSANTDHITISVDINGYIIVKNGDGTTLGITSGPVCLPGAWQHIEAKVAISDTLGEVRVRVEGAQVLEITGADTRNSAVDDRIYSFAINYPSAGGTPAFYIKDYVIWDTTGAWNNDFLGTVQVLRLVPDGDVAMPWALSSGAVGWDLLNDAPAVDTNYISAGAAPIPAAAQMSLTNLPIDVSSVRAVIPITRSSKTDGGDGNLQVGMVSGGFTGNGVNRAITTAFTYYWDVIETDPATGGVWAPAAVNAADIKLNRTL